MLGSADLAAMRDVQRQVLPQTCDILRPSGSVNAVGEEVITWGTAGSAVPCRLARARARLAAVGEQVTLEAGWVATLAHDADVRAGDRMVVDGQTYEVIAVWQAHAWRTATRVDLKRLE